VVFATNESSVSGGSFSATFFLSEAAYRRGSSDDIIPRPDRDFSRRFPP